MQTISKQATRSKQTAEERQARNVEALERGSRMGPSSNDGPVVMQFRARGFDNIETFGPRQNVRTYAAWQALGRQVRKGEKSVHCTVWIHGEKDNHNAKTGEIERKSVSFPRSACLFHVSQTDAKNGGAA